MDCIVIPLTRSKIKLSRLSGKLKINWQCIIFLVASWQEMTSLACKQALVGRRMNLLGGYEIRVTYQQMQASSFSRSTKDYFIIWPHRLVSRREAFGGYIGEKLGNKVPKALWQVLTGNLSSFSYAFFFCRRLHTRQEPYASVNSSCAHAPPGLTPGH